MIEAVSKTGSSSWMGVPDRDASAAAALCMSRHTELRIVS
jgi:hypothetical protein